MPPALNRRAGWQLLSLSDPNGASGLLLCWPRIKGSSAGRPSYLIASPSLISKEIRELQIFTTTRQRYQYRDSFIGLSLLALFFPLHTAWHTSSSRRRARRLPLLQPLLRAPTMPGTIDLPFILHHQCLLSRLPRLPRLHPRRAPNHQQVPEIPPSSPPRIPIPSLLATQLPTPTSRSKQSVRRISPL